MCIYNTWVHQRRLLYNLIVLVSDFIMQGNMSWNTQIFQSSLQFHLQRHLHAFSSRLSILLTTSVVCKQSSIELPT